ncbi:MAG: glycosyltransferase family 39 protein [Candidatus Aminicenantes bacterium]|nr:glycosyltransferase family 39 protein [Candidatus Aminicenantes bacterium]
MNSKKIRGVFFCLFLIGAAVRAVDVPRPADGRIRESWRECDYAALARNFAREGMNILRPRIDWRGTGPGYAEMEFPIIPWTMAVFYKIFGLHEEIGRLLMWIVSLLTLLVFFALARRLLPPPGAVAASLFFVLSPLAIRVSNALQPEGLMLLFLLLGVHFFLRWLDEGARSSYWISIASTSAAILAKAPAAHIGILFVGLLLWKKRIRAFRRADVWVFGLLALAPAAVWYIHAHRFYLEFGNSLGLSNESHWFGWDLVRSPRALMILLAGAARMEGIFVWTPLGAAFLGALFFLRRRSDVLRIILWWLFAIGVYYLAAIRTVGDSWATYYHVIAVPPAALTIGAVTAWFARRRHSSDLLRFERISVVVGLSCVFGFEAFLVVRDFHPRMYEPLYRCAASFASLIPGGELILATGGPSKDETGRPVAYNAPYFFYWLDCKGWNIPSDEISPGEVRSFARKGARFFIGEKGSLAATPGLEEELRASFAVIAECPEAILFRLHP